MFKFLRNIVLLFVVALIVGEVVVRVTHAVSDIPQRLIDENGIQKYYPNQTGYWLNGTHTWKINELGWPGELPDSYDNLVTIIGDSFIENFMNPNECHQAIFLKERLVDYNFLEASRSGVSFIEAFEIAKQLDSLQPISNLIYVNDNDFIESVKDIKTLNDITQLDLKKENIVYGVMKSPGLKKILYNFKLAYYFYNRFPVNLNFGKQTKIETTKHKKEDKSLKNKLEIELLLSFVKDNYDIKDKVLVFHPNSNEELIELCKKKGFSVINLDSNIDSKSWTFDYDHHWTCYGHKQVANQVKQSLLKNNLLKR